MNISFEKIAPSAAVMAFAGYCAWPSLSAMMSEPPPPPPQRKPATLADASFSPELPPMPMKNPFGGKDAATLTAEREKALAEALAAAKEAEAASAAAAAESAEAEEVVTAGGPASPLDGLKLNGTFLVGDRRWAVINGRVYGRLDDLATDNVKAPLQIADVLPHKVLLKYRGRDLELTYNDIASLFESSAQARAAGSDEAADAPAVGKSRKKSRSKRAEE